MRGEHKAYAVVQPEALAEEVAENITFLAQQFTTIAAAAKAARALKAQAKKIRKTQRMKTDGKQRAA